MTMEERFSYRLVRDLFAHKEAIFSELKRASSLTHSGTVTAPRPRAISSDESNRKANMEARSRAIIAAGAPRSRATSPQPSPAGRGHRRDRSSGGPETRFPIASPPMEHTRHARASTTSTVAHSLEVPDTPPLKTVELANGAAASPPKAVSNGPKERSITSATYIPGMDDEMGHHVAHSVAHPVAHPVAEDVGVEKKNSLSRSAAPLNSRFSGRKPVGVGRVSQDTTKRDSVGSLHGSDDSSRVGVSLTDKPMDD